MRDVLSYWPLALVWGSAIALAALPFVAWRWHVLDRRAEEARTPEARATWEAVDAALEVPVGCTVVAVCEGIVVEATRGADGWITVTATDMDAELAELLA